MSQCAPQEDAMPFIVLTSKGQAVGDERKLIRSRVMRGKNRKKTPTRPASWINIGFVGDTAGSRQGPPPLSIPSKIGGEFSLTLVADEMSPAVLEIVWECMPVSHFNVGCRPAG
jgi:hypothetical protein